MELEDIKKKVEEYKKEIATAEDHKERMIQMLNQQEAKIQQLIGAIGALENLIKGDKENVRIANTANSAESGPTC